MAGKIALGIPCEICGEDAWWDNRQDKKNPKSPDYKCSNKDGCRDPNGYPNGRWEKNRAKWGHATGNPQGMSPQNLPQKPQEPAGAPKGGRLTPDDTTPDERGERVYTWPALSYTYSKLYEAVFKVVRAHTPEELHVDQNAVQAGVATLLIQGEKAHIPLLHPRPKPKEVVQAPPKKESYAERPAGLDEEDFDDAPLPF